MGYLPMAFEQLNMNTCPFCNRESLSVVEKEETQYSLDKYGAKKKEIGDGEYDAYLKCTHCGEIFEATTIGGRWCIVDERPVKVNRDILAFNPFEKRRE